MSRRSLAAVGLTVVALFGFAGCSGGGGQDRVAAPPAVGGQPAEVTAALDRAVVGVDAARAELLAAPGAVVEAATALDAADEASSTGQADSARSARGRVSGKVAAAEAALASVPERARAYREALVALQEAAAPLDAAQERALTEVVTTGEREAAATEAFATAARTALPAYTGLDEAQGTWLTRASDGWYRDRAEAAGAYAVLVRPQREPLADARAALRAADDARRGATEAQRAALSAADAALAPLRDAA